MKKIVFVFIFICFTISLKAQECIAFDKLITEGDTYYNSADYRKAIDCYTAAWLDCPARSKEARTKINTVYDKIEDIKNQAIIAEQTAKEEKEKAEQLVEILMPFEAKADPFAYFWKKGKTELQNFNYKEAYTALLFAKNAENIPTAQKDSVAKYYAGAEWYNSRYSLATEYFYSNNFEKAKPYFKEIADKNPADSLSLFMYKASFEDLNEADMVKVEGGEFIMGEEEYNSNYIEHPVKLTTFYISKYEVTNAQYARFLNQYTTEHKTEPEYTDSIAEWFIYLEGKNSAEMFSGIYIENGIYKVVQGYAKRPVTYISWYGANAYCQFYGGSLPTEAQWEYTARGGNSPFKRGQGDLNGDYVNGDFIYAGSNNIDSVAWYWDNSDSKTHPVGTKKPNELGIYDMSGNLYEWCLDWYSSYYYQTCKDQGIITNPAYMQGANFRILRGGSWFSDDDYCRAAYRSLGSPESGDYDFGFRFLRNP